MQHRNEEQFSGTSESIYSADSEIRSIPGQWSELPSLLLEKIYSFLGRKDQVNMSLVCSHWSKGYESPSVWKTFIFELTEKQLKSENCPVKKFVLKYSKIFKHVEIRYQKYLDGRYSLIAVWCSKLKFLLQNMASNSKLISVKFEFPKYKLWLDFPTYYDTYRTIVDFMGSQRNLKRMEFHDFGFTFFEAVEFLKNVTEKSRESLTVLLLQGFDIHDCINNEQYSRDMQNLPFLVDFPSLETLEIDYSLTFLSMVKRLSSAIGTVKHCQTLKLSKIILRYVSENIPMDDVSALTSNDLNLLKTLYPDLEIDLNLEFDEDQDDFSTEDFEFLIAPGMPIRHLYCKFMHLKETETRVFFGRLLTCNINDYLVSLMLEWESCELNLEDTTLIPFLRNCKKLNDLLIFVSYSVIGVDTLIKSLLEKRPKSLESVHITIQNAIAGDYYSNLKSLASEYETRLEMEGLNLKVEFTFHNSGSFDNL